MDATLPNIAERFAADIEGHQLTIRHDDGVYRSVRCQRAETWVYGFDVTTWPGHLAFTGDMGDFLFARITDMFEFFRRNEPNPDYWSEKLRGPGPAHKAVLEFDKRAYKDYKRECGIGDIDPWGPPLTINDAHRNLVEAGVDPIDLPSLARYSIQFLWACHAIPWAIDRYDEAKAQIDPHVTPASTREDERIPDGSYAGARPARGGSS